MASVFSSKLKKSIFQNVSKTIPLNQHFVSSWHFMMMSDIYPMENISNFIVGYI